MELEAKKEASASINTKLNELSESPLQPTIYKVHNQYLQSSDDTVYEPAVVAIGPYHRAKQRLNMIQQHKLRYLKSLLLRRNQNVDVFISATAEIEEAARSCYAEDVGLNVPEFIEMLVLDSCFIVELLRRFRNGDSGGDIHDPIFEMEWILHSLRKDLILFENQIPFFVLCRMFDLIDGINQHQKLMENVCFFFGIGDHRNWRDRNPNEVKHLLHLMHITLRPSSQCYINLTSCPLRRDLRLIPSASELKNANVGFQKIESGAVFEVEFQNGVLKMPALVIQDGTESLFRNFIVFEQYFPGNRPTYVTDYVVILDCLVNTMDDVEILAGCGIIDNLVGDNVVAADIINRLAHSVLMSENYFVYEDLFRRINAHCRKGWNRARAALRRDYFNSPWAYVSFFAAVLLLLLTVAQTVLTAVQL